MKTASLYELSFPDGKSYIGFAINPQRRWMAHRQRAQSGVESPVYEAIRAFGWSEVKRRILCVGRLDYVQGLEARAIASFGTLKPGGYNYALGGNTSPSKIPEIAARQGASLRASGKARVVAERSWADPTVRARRLAAGSTPECREAKGSSKRGILDSAETRLRKSVALRGLKKSAQHCDRMRTARLGLRYITNGVLNRMVFSPTALPDGWRFGMAPKKRRITS